MTFRVKNLTELLSKMAARGFKSNDEIKTTLHNLLGPEIQVNYELCKDKPIGSNMGRILLTAKKNIADFNKEIVKQCNGVVIFDWKVISMPSRSIDRRPRMKDIEKYLADYTIYKINDGTTATLYWFKDQWRLSSTNGFDVTDYQWISTATYMQVVTELLGKYELTLDSFDKNLSYTIGFRHESFHPLSGDPARLWLLQAAKGINVVETDIKIPRQNSITYTGGNAEIIAKIRNENVSALEKYLSTGECHYGYILRSATQPDVMLESSLLRSVRTQLYNLPKVSNFKITPENRLEYTVMRAYLSVRVKNEFIQLFPQYKNYYCKYDVIFKEIVEIILSILRRTERGRVEYIKSLSVHSMPKVVHLAIKLSAHIDKSAKINAMDINGKSIIEDFVLDGQYLDMYSVCLLGE